MRGVGGRRAPQPPLSLSERRSPLPHNLISLSLSLSLARSCRLPSPAYHLWLFTWDTRACTHARGACCGTANRLNPAAGRFRVASEAARNRQAWVRAVLTDSSSGGQTYAVQVLRSHIMAATLLATTCGLIAIQGMLPALLDAGRLRQLRELASRDPVAPGVEGRWPSEGVKLVSRVCLGMREARE